MADGLPKELFPFGFQQAPGNWKHDPMIDMMYSMGQPGVFTTGSDGLQYRNVFQDQFNNNLSQGLSPYTGFPKGWGDANGDGQADNGQDKKPNPLKGMPRWYQEWYNNSGRTGSLPRSKGLLDV